MIRAEAVTAYLTECREEANKATQIPHYTVMGIGNAVRRMHGSSDRCHRTLFIDYSPFLHNNSSGI